MFVCLIVCFKQHQAIYKIKSAEGAILMFEQNAQAVLSMLGKNYYY